MFRKMFTLSFDDSTVQDEKLIELIDKYNLRATFNINTGFFGQKHDIIHYGIKVNHDDLDAETIKTLYRNHEVAVHTVTHPNLKNCDDERVIKEVKDNYDTITELTGKEIVGMAYPCGGDCYDERVIKLITENSPVRFARTTKSTHDFKIPERFMEWHPTCHFADDESLELAEKFVKAEPTEDMLLYVWGHSFELEKNAGNYCWERLEEIFKTVASNRDITYMTNGEIYRYVTKKRLKEAEDKQ